MLSDSGPVIANDISIMTNPSQWRTNVTQSSDKIGDKPDVIPKSTRLAWKGWKRHISSHKSFYYPKSKCIN